MLQRISPLLLCLAFAFAFVACDSGDDDDGGNGGAGSIGSGNVTVTGSFSDSFSGNAAFGIDPDNSSFSMAVFEGAIATPTGGLVAIGRSSSGRPGTGSYAIGTGATDFAAAYAGNVTGGASGDFVAGASGTLTITNSNSDRVEGSFSFTGTTLTGGQATVEGSFRADFAQNIPSTGF